jgi:hypothetical protein
MTENDKPETLEEEQLDAAVGGLLSATSSGPTLTSTSTLTSTKTISGGAICPCGRTDPHTH